MKERLFQMEQGKKRLLEKKYGIAVKDGGRVGYKVGGFDKARRAVFKNARHRSWYHSCC